MLFPQFKANARVKLAKTGHGPHSFTLVVICVVWLLFVLFCVLFVCKCVPYYCHWVSTQLQLINISYINIYHLCHRYLQTHDEAHRRLWFLWSADGTNTKAVGRCGCIGGCAFFGSNRNGAKFFKPSRQDIQDGINMATFR